ncbi:ferredoxin--NADP reductase [Microbacterium sp. zg-Y818]|uniref:ferredoxin--NADP reductase n=1 Tax=unclassified Microbacterium TaxID=2609290 RepID=UPI00214CAE8D|nr:MULTISPECIES: ferredoxin--NADP reductase [unclassified Microbacterium]MCR2799379.1 ferredoxin--NADP reductase [Microbacterium sp. zg.Y818]WIM21378.1 ferredoxin--NADP reductase [Microbacterium sp. zg-Y818]
MNSPIAVEMEIDETEEVVLAEVAAGGPGHRLTVREVIVETEDARSVVFDIPEESAEAFTYQPGQFLTLRVVLPDGSAVARCYSLSSTPGLNAAPKITVKRIAGGAASGWLCESLEAGAQLDALPPTGIFTVRDTSRDLLMFAGGSGITPVMSILRDALHNGTNRVILAYANRDERSVIFAEELKHLARDFPDRLLTVHLLTSVQGLPSAALLTGITRMADLDASTAFVCGPAPFMDGVERALREAGMPREHIVIERFVSLTADPFAAVDIEAVRTAESTGDAVPLTVELDGEQHELAWPSGVTLLDFLRSKQIDAPFSCREGACSACSCRLTSGRVSMVNNQILEKEDLDEGWILGCQAVVDGDEPVSVTYD